MLMSVRILSGHKIGNEKKLSNQLLSIVLIEFTIPSNYTHIKIH